MKPVERLTLEILSCGLLNGLLENTASSLFHMTRTDFIRFGRKLHVCRVRHFQAYYFVAKYNSVHLFEGLSRIYSC